MCDKRRKAVSSSSSSSSSSPEEEEELLIPGLPNHISHLILAHLPPSLIFNISSGWRRLLYSPLFPPFLSLYALLFSSESINLMSYDPLARDWLPLPPPPPNRILLRHPSFISRRLPVQSLSVSGRLILLAATDDRLSPALPLPLVFSPQSGDWCHGPALPAARRWCAAGTMSGSVYVASGMGSRFSSEVARSFHRWSVGSVPSGGWEALGGLKDGRFSREAIEAVGCRGRLWMVNVKGDAAKQGAVYQSSGGGGWEEMPEAMIRGWRGPAAAMAEDEIYAVDESKGSLGKWEWDEQRWSVVLQSQLLCGAHQISTAPGKVCALVDGGRRIVVVDVATVPPKLWLLETPPGSEAVAVHILPRMSRK